MGRKPAHEFKLGKIKAAVWANEAENNEVWFNVTLTRSYKHGDTWKDTTSMGRDDLPIAIKAMEMAYNWIWRKKLQVERAERNAASKVLAGSGSAA